MRPKKKFSIASIIISVVCFIAFGVSVAMAFMPIYKVYDTNVTKIDDGAESKPENLFETMPELDVSLSIYDISKAWIQGDQAVEDIENQYNEGTATVEDVLRVATAKAFVYKNPQFYSYMIILYVTIVFSLVCAILSLFSPYFSTVCTTNLVFAILNIVVFAVGLAVGSNYLVTLSPHVQALVYNVVFPADYTFLILAYMGMHIMNFALIICMNNARKYNHTTDEFVEL